MAFKTSKSNKHPSLWTQSEKRNELWRRGVLAPWKLHAGQQKMNEAIVTSESKIFVVNSSRRLGKSYLLCVLALERALSQPGSQIKFAAPNQKMARKIIMPLFRQIMEDCPKAIQPVFRNHDSMYEFPNGSEIHIAGTEMQQIDNLRGQACDLALIDEAGFVSDLSYVVDSVLMPQTLTRPGSRLIMASTPPITPDHPFSSKYIQKASALGAYAQFTIYDNPLLTEDQINQYKEEAGGENSTAWRREYMAEIVADASNAIIPEAQDGDLMDRIVCDIKKPEFYNPITVIDLGYIDNTGSLFAYYHFPAGKIVIEQEKLVNKTTSKPIVEFAKSMEEELWGSSKLVRNRIVDGNRLQIEDLNEDYDFPCRMPDKSDLEANVNKVRLAISSESVIINPRCKQLISEIKFAVWNKQRNAFSRTSSGGHWDLLAALVYLIKHVDRSTNPYPAGYGYNEHNDWGFEREHSNTTIEALRAMVPFIRKKRNGR